MSLRWQVTLAFLVSCTLVLGGLGTLTYRREAQELRKQLDQAIAAAELRLQQALREPVWDLDLDLAQNLLHAELASNHHLAGLRLKLDTGQSFAFGRDEDWQVIGVQAETFGSVDGTWSLQRDEEAIASIDYRATERWIDAALLQRGSDLLIMIAAIDLVLVGLVMILLRRMLLRRLGGIATAIEQAPDVEASGGDEVTVLMSGAQSLLARLTEILDAIQDAVIVVDGEMRIRRTNPAAAELLGKAQSELHGALLAEVLPLELDGRNAAHTIHSEVVSSGKRLRSPESLILRRGDVLRHVALMASPAAFGHSGPRGAIIALHDLTHLVRVEEQLRQAQKLESIGQLAGGVAHDFNNMLGAITGAAELVKMSGDDPAKREKFADMILRIAHQAADLNTKLLAFSRKGPVQLAQIAVAEIVEQACTMLKHSIDRRIEMLIDAPEEALAIKGDSAALVNCLLNLGINARDAMPDGGVLRIAWRRVPLDKRACQELGDELEPGSYVRIDVSDSGTGIPDHLMASIFDPFFTTKPTGSGTGLGLSATYGTVKAHDGHISVASSATDGTTFSIHLPLQDAVLTKDESGQVPLPARAGAHVLVIDDDPGIREVAAGLLEAKGIHVDSADSGQRGIELFGAKPERYDAILLDLIMPDLSGHDTFDALRKIRADIPIVLVSGYNASIDIDAMLANGARALLTKPFRSSDLMRTLTPILDAR